MQRLRPDPVMGDVVRARLDALVAEIAPRRPLDRPHRLAGAAGPGPDAEPDDEPPSVDEPAPAGEPVPAEESTMAKALARTWEFGRAHLAVVGVVGLVGLLGAVWSLTEARTVPIAVASPTAVSPSVTPSPSRAPEPLRVHVLGAVARPGVVSLPPGSRVEDAIAAAGGLSPGARPGELNLAAVVADGVQIVVGDADAPGGQLRGVEGPASGVAGGAAAIDLNAATVEQLDALPGVGPVTAQAILAWRSQHKAFSRIEELQEVDGIGPKTYERIAPHVRV